MRLLQGGHGFQSTLMLRSRAALNRHVGDREHAEADVGLPQDLSVLLL